MIIKTVPILAILASSVALGAPAAPAALVGAAAPAFTLTSTEGKTVSLSDYKGKFVVLEWLNFDCPFVRKHYNGDNMQRLQREYTKKGVVWLSIVSSAAGQQGNYPPSVLEAKRKAFKSAQTALLTDFDGKVGRSYGAKATPQMVVISPKGVILYNGAIDDQPTPDPASLKTAHNYLSAALDAAMSGKPVAVTTTQPYGCSVKYAE